MKIEETSKKHGAREMVGENNLCETRHRRARDIVACLLSSRFGNYCNDGLVEYLRHPMSTTPVPSASRGDITLQPSYFTSSLYVEPLRKDINNLIELFSEYFTKVQPPSQPFAHFKTLWSEQGWTWMHFKVFDGRAREKFIEVTERLFLGKIPMHIASLLVSQIYRAYGGRRGTHD